MGISNRELKRRGYDPVDLALAKATQDAARRAGAPARSLGEILEGKPPRPRPGAAVADLTARQLRRRGGYGQAALLLDQAALAETDPEKAERARFIAHQAKGLGRAKQLEFDLYGGGNVSLSHQYLDAVQARLLQSGATPAERGIAFNVIAMIVRHLVFAGHDCTKTAAELCEITGINKDSMAAALALLERVGAIIRVKRGRTKVITVTPEGAFRGSIDDHPAAVARYSAEVVKLRPERT
jgi:hypothetical protein